MPAVTLPGVPESAAVARDFTAKCLAGFPSADDAVLCVDELVSNAVQHSRSGQPGGLVEVRVTLTGGGLLAEVRDDGPLAAAAAPSCDLLAERGRGLLLVEALAAVSGSAGPGVWWFWMPWGAEL